MAKVMDGIKDLILEMKPLIKETALEDIIKNSSSNGLNDICIAACAIVFICITIKFVVSLVNEGYSLNLLKRMLLQMAILGVIVSPPVYKAIAGIYKEIFTLFMDTIGNSEIENLRQAMYDFFDSGFKDGDIGVKKLFGIIEIETTPLEILVAVAAYILFLVSMYELMAIPTFFACLTIYIVPILIAASPLFEDMLGKVANLLVGWAIIFPVFLFGLQTFLCPFMTLVGDLLLKENMTLLLIYSLTFAAFIPSVLEMFGNISGLSFVGSLSLAFPITWITSVIVKPIQAVIKLSQNKKVKA